MTALLFVLTNYWWAFAIVLLALAYAGLRKVASAKAKAFISKYLATAEKTVFDNAAVGIPKVADAVYSAIPLRFRAFLPRMVFDTLVTELFTEAKKLVDSQKDVAK